MHLIKKEQEVVSLAKFLCTPEEFRGRQMDPSFSLNGFKHDGAGRWSDDGGKGLEVVEWAVSESRKERIESFFHLVLRGSGNPSECSTVKGLVKGDDFMTGIASVFGPAETSGELDESVVGFGSGVTEKDAALKAETFFNKTLCKLRLSVYLVKIAAVD